MSSKMMLKGRILLFSITGCKHCKAAKSKLELLELPYFEVNLDNHPNERATMTKLTNQHSVPQIFFNDKHIGGNAEFQELSDEALQTLIAYVRDNEAPENTPQPLKANELDADARVSDKMDELSSLVEALREQNGIVHDHRHFIRSYPNTFTGEDAITFIAQEKGLDRTAALEIAQQLITKKFAAALKEGIPMKDDKTLYRFMQDWPSNALNAGLAAYKSITLASELSILIRKSILKLYGSYLSNDGKMVDYTGLGQSPEFEDYVQLSAQLQRVQAETLSRGEKLAFFINIYNALVIHGNVKIGFPNTTWQRYKFFNDAKYIIGGHSYSLQDIENGVLRSNRKGVGMLSKPFSKSDPRMKTILHSNEPLVHFALVCGAKSCPPIKTYSHDNVMNELEIAAAAFLESDDGCCVDIEKNMIGLSMIFKWYKEDFGETPYEVLKWVRNHMSLGDKKQHLTKLLEEKVYKLVYLTYDWGSNGK
ncbi:uncharacterized protein LOC143466002 isoform X2 [Clavelina lepadiformis]|uniref:DEP domain-containing protein n=2 Tax=Clavelina lepadiformis TaxID=159417 RepID=A0ABP0EXY3_CLALP